MSMNITEVRLLAVPLENDYKHTLYFTNLSSQLSYFAGKQVHTCDNFSYQRKDRVIRYPMDYDELVTKGANYVMYRNNANTTKWYFAFITKMEYVNEGVTHIHIETDVIQTWLFDYTVRPSFVEREHCKDDTIGEHTIDEGLETGEYINQSRCSLSFGDDLMIVVGTTKNPDGEMETGYHYNGIYSGMRYYCFQSTASNAINKWLAEYDADGIGEAVQCMFLAPSFLASKDGAIEWGKPIPETWKPHKMSLNKATGQTYDKEITFNFRKDYLDNLYTPRNKKLMCYPYRFIMATNNAGASAVYKFENFRDEEAGTTERNRPLIEPSFTVEMCLTPGCSGRMYPVKYNGPSVSPNYDEGLTMGKFPALNWASDVFTNWMTQNSVNLALDMLSGVGQIVAGGLAIAGTGGIGAVMGGGSIVGGVSQIAGAVGQIHQASFTPPQVKGNVNSGDVTTAMKKNEFDFIVRTIKNEYAKIIDDFFDMYGYKCHRVKTPETDHRMNYWFTKTIDANIDGNIPMEDMQKIKNCYNSGITFWKKPSNIGKYYIDGVPLDNATV